MQRRLILTGAMNRSRQLSAPTNPDAWKRSLLKPSPFKITGRSVGTIPKWPFPSLESQGNYVDDFKILEAHIPGPLYERQQSLPRLPVPSLQSTVKSFIPTALPLAESEEEIKTLLLACDKFPEQASLLHSRLLRRSREEYGDSSWLQHWWNTEGYLKIRDPVVINVSYFFHFVNDPTLAPPSSHSDPGIQRAAAMIRSASVFRHSVCSGSYPGDVVGKKRVPLCSVQYNYMFHACRIPKHTQDTYKIYDPSRSRHCIVACKGNFFALDMVNEKQQSYSVEVLERKLRKCVELAEARLSGGRSDVLPELGWLTSWDRDSWAAAREDILNVGNDRVRNALQKLESGAFLICLDDESPDSNQEAAGLFLHGNVTSSMNRWFDKSLQIIVTKDGQAGFVGEHSMMDGMPVINFMDAVVNTTYEQAKNESTNESTNHICSEQDLGVEEIFSQCVDTLNHPDILKAVNNAKTALTTLIRSHNITTLKYKTYGSNVIKKSKYSPDAYVQIAMHLATYRLFQQPAATYEASQMRTFLHGRTETTRTVSPQSVAFVRTMGFHRHSPPKDQSEIHSLLQKLDLLKEATDAHSSYTKMASSGGGVDRHFFGLSMMSSLEEGSDATNAPDLFQHPLYLRSKHWRVSTSSLSHPKFSNWGYGEVVPDGVGLSYMIKENDVTFNITARQENEGWTERLGMLLEESLDEMKDLTDWGMVQKGGAGRSKL